MAGTSRSRRRVVHVNHGPPGLNLRRCEKSRSERRRVKHVGGVRFDYSLELNRMICFKRCCRIRNSHVTGEASVKLFV